MTPLISSQALSKVFCKLKKRNNNGIDSVMMSTFALSVVDRGFKTSPGRIIPKTMKLVFVASSLSTQH
jgi:hypothetical protein